MGTSENENWQTFGHQAVKSILNKQIAAQRFPHAYLFAGQSGLGKKTLALEFARKVLGTEKLNTHPDFAVLDEPGEITMEPVLEFISRLSFKPFLAQKKIAVINNAQNLNLQAANALLKTLEEPSPSSIIILLADSARLLPTIVSRCQVLNFYPFSENQLADFAESNGLQTTQSMRDLSFGSPARLKRLSQDEGFLSSEEKIVGQYKNFQKMRLGEKLMSISGLAELEAEDLTKKLLTWLMWQRGELRESPGDYVKVRALLDSLKGLKRNQNKKLILQGLLLKI
jgi:DNA polymerase-3 subunit delta'